MAGLFADMQYEEGEFILLPGERMFLYTDGLFTQPNRDGQSMRQLGMGAMWKKVGEQVDIAAATKEIVAEFDRARGDVEQIDDVTVIGIEIGKTKAA